MTKPLAIILFGKYSDVNVVKENLLKIKKFGMYYQPLGIYRAHSTYRTINDYVDYATGYTKDQILVLGELEFQKEYDELLKTHTVIIFECSYGDAAYTKFKIESPVYAVYTDPSYKRLQVLLELTISANKRQEEENKMDNTPKKLSFNFELTFDTDEQRTELATKLINIISEIPNPKDMEKKIEVEVKKDKCKFSGITTKKGYYSGEYTVKKVDVSKINYIIFDLENNATRLRRKLMFNYTQLRSELDKYFDFSHMGEITSTCILLVKGNKSFKLEYSKIPDDIFCLNKYVIQDTPFKKFEYTKHKYEINKILISEMIIAFDMYDPDRKISKQISYIREDFNKLLSMYFNFEGEVICLNKYTMLTYNNQQYKVLHTDLPNEIL